MDGLHPEPGGMPRLLPVFPLAGALLLPHGKLPLNIFEPRYKAMVEDALADHRMIGMIQPDGSMPGADGAPALFGIGCAGRLSSFSETDDGRYLIALSGITRFDVKAELEMRRGYRRVTADYSRFTADLDPPPDHLPQRGALLTALRAYFTANGFEAKWDAIDEMMDDELVTTLSMICPFDPVERQALLEADDAFARATTLTTLLQMGAHPGQQGDGRPLS